jgi:hypothetical protein
MHTNIEPIVARSCHDHRWTIKNWRRGTLATLENQSWIDARRQHCVGARATYLETSPFPFHINRNATGTDSSGYQVQGRVEQQPTSRGKV